MAVAAVRRPTVAGYFYPFDPTALRQSLSHYVGEQSEALPAKGVVVPHGSFQHAGSLMARTLARIAIPPICVLLGPVHTPTAWKWSCLESGAYATPLGESPVAETLAAALLKRCAFLSVDPAAHAAEHSLEVPLTALQWLRPQGLSIVPILAGADDPEASEQLGKALAAAIKEAAQPVLVLASADLAQFVDKARARDQVAALVQAIQSGDASQFWMASRVRGMQPCGASAVAALMGFTQAINAGTMDVVDIDTSADHGGDPDSAAGYAGVIIR